MIRPLNQSLAIQGYASLIDFIQKLDEHIASEPLGGTAISDLEAEYYNNFLKVVKLPFSQFEFGAIDVCYNEIEAHIENRYSRKNIRDKVIELKTIIHHELASQICFVLPREAHKYLDKKFLNEKVCSVFPEAAFDLLEAQYCFGLGLYTACVFHCMNVLQIVFPTVLKDLLEDEVPVKSDVLDESWGIVINHVHKQVKELEKKPKSNDLKKRIEILAELAYHMTNIKHAFRNPTMHARGQFTPRVAQDVHSNTVSFAEYLIQFRREDAS